MGTNSFLQDVSRHIFHEDIKIVQRFDHEIFSTVILSLLLIQEGHLSASCERMCLIVVNCLEDKACLVKMWLGKLTAQHELTGP